MGDIKLRGWDDVTGEAMNWDGTSWVSDPIIDPATAISNHESAVDPHTGYQKESEKGAANGYASLGAGGLVPISQLASGTPDGTKYIRDDGTLVTPASGSQAHAVGDVVFNADGINPATKYGYGTWVQIAQGKFIVGQDPLDTDFDVAEETGGTKTHIHTGHSNHVVTQPNDHAAHTHVAGTLVSDTETGTRKGGTTGAPTLTDSHDHAVTGSTGNPSATLTHTATAVDAHSAHDSPSHLPPYLVLYAWKRTI